ncbi:MAG: VCBS domain-containing protein [Pseudomonadota bacterium]
MPTSPEYAMMAGNVYRASRDENNRVPVPFGWKPIDGSYEVNTHTGFEAIAYKRNGTNEIVISYAGTDPNELPDWINNVQMGVGLKSTQLLQAADFYQKIKQSNPGADITFTGHSLGGGLAGLMGVFFNKHAEVFDPAPFRQSATVSNRDLIANKYPDDSDLASFYSYIDFTQPENNPASGIRGESRVKGYYTVGEILTGFLPNLISLNRNAVLPLGHGSVANHADSLLDKRFDLHSISLLAAFLLQPEFRTTTQSLKELIPLIFDTELYGQAKLKGSGDAFMELLVRHEATPGDPLFTGFLDDLQDIIRAGGLALSDDQLNKGLIALAIQAYYEQDSGFTQELYQPVAGGLQIDKGALDATKSYQQYLQAWLQGQYSAEMDKITAALPHADRVYLATRPGMIAVAEKDKTALMLGGTGSDTLTGGDLADTLIGGQRNDILEGGKGDDTLMGGEGHDHYIWNTGDGNDTIIDPDKVGDRIIINGTDKGDLYLGGTFTKEEGQNLWKSADGKIQLSHNSPWKITLEDGSTLELGDYSDGDYGLHLKDTPEQNKPTTQTLTGDKKPKDHDPDKAGIQYRYDSDGNLIVSGEIEADRRDYLTGAYSRNDRIEGRGGNDFIDADHGSSVNASDDIVLGGDGNDIIWGNEGRDRLEGGAGKDWINGGPDDDRIYADKEIPLADALQASAQGSGQPGDWLDGDEGDDVLIGGNDDDLLMGGPGKDILVGGAGNDTLYGGYGTDYAAVRTYRPESDQQPDQPYPFPELQWTVMREIVNGDTYQTDFDITLATSFTALSFYEEKDDPDGDMLYGGAGDDWIMAGEGDDYAEGGDGNDAIFGEAGDDILNGGKGNDSLVGDNPDRGNGDGLPGARHGDDALAGGEGDDSLSGNGGNDMLSGGAGNDVMQGDDSATPGQYHGDDTLDGGDGNDTMWGQGGDDVLVGGAGDDYLEGDYSTLDASYQGDDFLDGGDGNDRLIGGGGNDFLMGGKGDDRMWGDRLDVAGDDVLDGGEGDDNLYGGGGKDYLSGGEGNDQIAGDLDEDDAQGGDDVIDGGAGDDLLCGHTGNDTIDGGDGNDRIGGGHGSDTLSGGAGNDEITGDADEDDDQGGDDVIDGGAGDDRLFGFTGNDTISGGDGDDQISGGKGNDWIDGGEGDNVIDGGEGDDVIFGGSGDDIYYRSLNGGNDRISDAGGSDRLVIELPTRFDLNDPDYALKMYNAIQQFLRLSLGSMMLQFDDGGVLHIEDFDPENPYGPEGIEWFQFDQLVLSKKELIDLLGFEIEGTPEADVLGGTALGDSIFALEGDDIVYGLGGDDGIFLDEGDDWADGGEGHDFISGGLGNDTLLGNAGDDSIYGGEGDDLLAGGEGSDELNGGDGNDTLSGGTGDDVLDGGNGNDTYEYAAGGGNDTAYAGPGSDTIRLTGLALSDVLLHREGSDLFVIVNADQGRFTAVDWFDPASGFDWLELGDGSLLDRAAVEASLYLNAAPVTVEDAVVMTEHGNPVVTGNVLDNDSDDHSVQGPGELLSRRVVYIEGYSGSSIPVSFDVVSYAGKLTVETAGTYQGYYGTLSLGKDGSYTYVLDSNNYNVQVLGAGQTLDDYFSYRVSDNDPRQSAESWGKIHVTLNGENDPPFSLGDMLHLQEDVTLEASGNVLANDIDPDAGTVLTVLNPGVYAGKYGTLTLAADGAYRYDLANDSQVVQELGRTNLNTHSGNGLMTEWDVFSYEVSDGTTTIPDVQILVEVVGCNDAPVLILPAPDQSVQAGADWSFTQPEGMFGDIDVGDTLNYNYLISSPDGAPTDWIDYDPDTRTLNGTAPDGAVGTIEITVVADDGIYGYEGDQPGLETPDTFTLTLSAPEPEPVPDTPDPVETPDMQVTAASIDPADAPVELPPGDPGTPGGSPMPTGVIPSVDTTTGSAQDLISSSRILTPASVAAPMPSIKKPAYSVHIHAPIQENGGDTCECQDTDERADPLQAGISADKAYEQGWIMNGGDGADLLPGEGGDDQIWGGGGDDLLIGGLGRDRIYGEAGDDQIAGDKGGLDEDGDDDFIDGGSGNDLIAGQGGNDTLIGGEGDDVIDGGDGDDQLSGNQGADRLQGGAGSDWLRGEDGDDVLFGETGNDLLDGGAGKDTLFGGSGEDRLLGGEGDDTLLGGDCSDVIEGNAGNDQVSGGTGHDRIDGGEGDDVLLGDGCNDSLIGGAGNDQLQGGSGEDSLDGGEGDDVLFGEDGNDFLQGGAGNDYLAGDGAESELMGDDRLEGGDGDDILLGEGGDDLLSGDAGNDKLQGGAGNDTLLGGEGDDVYFFSAGNGNDHFADSGGSDWLVLENLNFDDILDLDVSAHKLIFKDGSELYLDDLDSSNLLGEGGIDYIQFADETVMTRQALIQEFVLLPGNASGEPGMGAKDTSTGYGSGQRGESDLAQAGKDEEKAAAVLWFASEKGYKEPDYVDLVRFADSSVQDGAALGPGGAETMAQWLVMDAALAAHLAKGNLDAANDASSETGAPGAMRFLGSATPWGSDPLSLAVSGSDIPKTFHGLNEGFGRIAG